MLFGDSTLSHSHQNTKYEPVIADCIALYASILARREGFGGEPTFLDRLNILFPTPLLIVSLAEHLKH